MKLKEKMVLTDIEKFFLSYAQISPSNVVAIAHLEGIRDIDMLEKALNMVKDRHSYFQYFIKHEGDHSIFFYDPDKSVPLTVLQEADEELWIKICETEMNQLIDIKTAPMMKTFLLQRRNGSSELIVSFSHIIADGINAVQFIRDVIYLLEKLTEGEKTPTIDNPQFLRPDTAHFPKSASPNMSIGQFEKDNFIIQSFQPDLASGASNFSYALGCSKKKSKLLPYHLSSEDSNTIFNLCHEKKITVNSLLSIALIFAMRDYIYEKDHGYDSPLWIKISTAIDLRRRIKSIKILPSDFGMWAGRCVLYSKIGKDTTKYDFSRSYHSTFIEYLLHNPFYYSNLMVQQQSNGSLNSTLGKSSVHHYPHVKITNIGDLNKMGIMSRYGKIKVNQIGFAAPHHRDWINDLGFGLCASGFNNKLILNFIYMEPARTEDEARLFIKRVINHMKN